MTVRKLTVQVPDTEIDILRRGLQMIAHEAPGGHADPNNPCYAEKRRLKDFAIDVLAAAEAVK